MRLRLPRHHRRGKIVGRDKGNLNNKVGRTSNVVMLRLRSEKRTMVEDRTMEEVEGDPLSCHRPIMLEIRACVILEAMVETKEIPLGMVVVDLDEVPEFLLDHLEDLVVEDRLEDLVVVDRPEDPVEVDPEGRQDRPEADRRGRQVGPRSKLRLRSTPTRMRCSTSHKHLGTLRPSKGWHFKSITNEGI